MIKSEIQFLNLIKFIPPLFIALIFIIITTFLYFDNKTTLKEERAYLKDSFIKNNKEQIKNEVKKLHEYILKVQEETENKIKENIKHRVYEAHKVATRIYNEYKYTKSKNEIIDIIKNSLVDIRFNDNRGYYFIYTMNYKCVLLPIARNLEGTSFSNFQDSKGTYLTREIIKDLSNKKEGYKNWWYMKPDNKNKYFKKIGFYKFFEPYDWFIGTGEYFIDFETEVKNQIIDYIDKLNNGTNEYFILDYNANSLFENQDLKEKTKKDIINIAKKGEGYLSENKSENISSKIFYIKGLKNWSWALGKSFNEKEIEKVYLEKELELNLKFRSYLFKLLIISVLATIVLLIISRYFSIVLEKKFKKYKESISVFMEEKTRNHNIIAQQSKMAAMGEMLGNIAHQWRQPLSLISTLSTGVKLQKELNSLDDEMLIKSLDNITHTAQYLSKTIDDFRNFYKSEKTQSHFYIKDSLDKVIKLTEASFKNHQIKVISQIENFELFGLENEFLQALINIFNNSKDALEEKENEDRIFFIRTYTSNRKKVIEIKDNAYGVEENIIEKICDPYFTTKTSKKGTGIGLYMTSEIINNHMNGLMTIKNLKFTYQSKEYQGLLTIIEFEI